MNTPTQLTQEQKRIRIAEACGWRLWREEWIKEGHITEDGCSGHTLDELPDWFASLDACHEMERALTNDGYWNYHQILAQKVSDDHVSAKVPLPLMTATDISATAAQRAEAFGMALGLW